MVDWRVGAARDLEVVDDDSWDADEAEAQVRRLAGGDPDGEDFDWELYRRAHLVYYASDPKKLGSYKLPFTKVRDGRLVASRRGLIAARVVLAGGRGGVDAPGAVAEAKRVVDRYLGEDGEGRKVYCGVRLPGLRIEVLGDGLRDVREALEGAEARRKAAEASERAKDLSYSEVERRLKQRGNIESIIAAWPEWAGSFTRCVEVLSEKEGIDDPEALCSWLHWRAEGRWPGEDRGKRGKRE